MSIKKIDTSDNLGKRLRRYRKIRDINGKTFSSIIGISQGTLSDIETNKTKPSTKTLAGVIRNTDINIEWLLTGEGDETASKNYDINSDDRIKYFGILNELNEWISEESRKNPKKEIWFEIQLFESFPAFKKWMENKDRKRDKAANE
jgi:transcriptional regulator with XRE-family HTH domain